MDIKAVLKQVRKIELVNRALVENLLQGAYRSRFRGQGMEFLDVREYEAGDDVRHIDWNVTARTNVPHIKQFQEEREMTFMLLVDVSASNDFGSVQRDKRQLAVEFCASLAFAAITNHDRVGLAMFTDRIEHYLPPKKGRGHVLRIIRDLITFTPQSRGTDLNCVLDFLAHIVKKKCTAFLVSDFLTDTDFEPKLRLASFRHDLLAAVITDPRERDLPAAGLIEVEDAESGGLLTLDSDRKKIRNAFAQAARDRRQELNERLRRCRVDSVTLDTGRSYLQAIVGFFRQRRRRR